MFRNAQVAAKILPLLTIKQVAVKNSKILKVAGLSLVGFCAVSIGVERANIGPVASQVAGFCGAFLGGWVAARRKGHEKIPEPEIAAIAAGSSQHDQRPASE